MLSGSATGNNNEIPLYTPVRMAKIQDIQYQVLAKWELSFMAGGNANGTATLEDILVVFHKTKHTLTIRPSSHSLRYLPKELKTYAHIKMCI